MELAVEAASHYFRFQSELLSAEDGFNRATLTEFEGRLVSVEIDIALELYGEAVGHLEVARKRVRKMLRSVRKAGCLTAFDEALAARLSEAGVNEFPRIGSNRSRIGSLEGALSVQKKELSTLRRYGLNAIKAAETIRGEIEKGLFVATLLGQPNELKTAKGKLEDGQKIVTALLAVTTRATAVALEDIFPLGSELLLEPKERAETVDICHGEFSEESQRTTSRTLSVAPDEVRFHLAHGDSLGSCR